MLSIRGFKNDQLLKQKNGDKERLLDTFLKGNRIVFQQINVWK